MTRTPRRIMVQDNLEMLPAFKFPISSDPVEVARLKEQRDKGINIVDHQAGGERVGNNVLALLHGEPELQKRWARLHGGVTLNSALMMFRETGPVDLADQPMYRWFSIPDQDKEGNRLGTEGHEATTLALLSELQEDTEAYASPEQEATRSIEKKVKIARRTAEASLLLGVLGEEFPNDEKEMMRQAKRLIRQMQKDTLRVALRIGMSPTAAMLRSENTALGQYIREASADGTLPPEIAEVFRIGAAEEREKRGY